MTKLFFIGLLALSIFSTAQEQKSARQIIDSINQSNWSKITPDLDSLANPKIDSLVVPFKDTIIIRDEIIIPQYADELPVTPFFINNFKEPKKWYFFGQNNLVFNQASFSNWNSGGNNNIGILGKINYNLSYRNRKHYLENILQMGYGWLASKGQTSRKTEDFINLMSNYGYDLGRNYYLSTGFQFISQFSPGFNFSETPDPQYENRISKFMAPGYLNAGIGVSYNPNENFQIIFRPANGKFTFVTDSLLQKKGRYGLERDGQKIRRELGALMNVIYRMKILKEVNFDHQIQFFSNYISNPERVDVAYNAALNIKFNKFISTVVSLDLVYDHDQIKSLQSKQTLGIGISYNLGIKSEEEPKTKKHFKPFIIN